MHKLINKDEWKLFHPLYIALFIGIAIPDIDAIVMVFFLAKGFTATQIGIGLALQSLFLLLAEIPTGLFADLFGKRRSVQMSWFMQAGIFAAFFFVTQPWMMWVLYSLRGIAQTFSSGAFEALPYDIAKLTKREDLINAYYRTEEFIYQLATVFSNINVIIFLFLVGATTTYTVFGQAHQGMDFLWLTGTVGYLVGSLILFRLPNIIHTQSSENTDQQGMKTLIKDAIQYSRTHLVVRKLIIMGIFTQIVLILFSDIVYQPFLLELGFNVERIAIIVSIGSFIAALFSLLSNYISKNFSTEKHYIESMFVIKAIILCALFLIPNKAISILFFFIYFGFDSFITPLMNPFKQFFYKSEMRATLGSLESVIKGLTAIILFPATGFMLDTFGPRVTIFTAIFPLLIAYSIFKSINHTSKISH